VSEVAVYNQDCIPGMAERLEPESVNCCITSIPFGALFSYSHKPDDIGNNQDGAHLHEGQFGLHMRFFIEQLFRVMAPGGIACIHIQQLLRYKVQHGYMGMRDFRGSCYLLFEAHGFQPHGEVAIPKNPQALRNGTPVLTPRGWQPINGLKVGGDVIGSGGFPVKITGVYPHEIRQMYRVTLLDGTAIECDGQHLWTIETTAGKKNGHQKTLTTDAMFQSGVKMPSGSYRYYIPLISSPVEFQVSANLPLDPYLVGALLGDGIIKGTNRSVGLCSDHAVISECLLPPGHTWRREEGSQRANGEVATYYITSPDARTNLVIRRLKDLGVYGLSAINKIIPQNYLFSGVNDRKRLLSGLLDTDGTVKVNPRNGAAVIKYSTISLQLAKDIVFLVQGLGGVAGYRKCAGGKYTYNGVRRQGQNIYEINIQWPGDSCPFLLPRKVVKWKPRAYTPRRPIASIELAGQSECTCITVDAADKLYVTNGCALTHNSVARRLNLHSLMFATAYRDARALAPAMNDYVLFFRKPGEGQPVKGIIESDRSVKLVEPSPIIRYLHNGAVKKVSPDYQSIPYRITTWNETTGEVREATTTGGKGINPAGWFTKEDWIKWASGCWDDILEIDTLEGYRCARESQEEKHVCPLQLSVIRRCMKLYSAPGDLILDPFMGIGSTAYVAVEQGRNCVGFELKESYHRMAEANVAKAREVFSREDGDELPLFRVVA
jgi:hypothetical protein